MVAMILKKMWHLLNKIWQKKPDCDFGAYGDCWDNEIEL